MPADLKICFARQAAAPAQGKLSKRQLFDVIASLKASADGKSECGQRLVCWYEDIAIGFAGAKPAQSASCKKE